MLADLIAMAMLMSDLQAFSYLVGAGILAALLLPFLVGLIVALAVVVALLLYFG